MKRRIIAFINQKGGVGKTTTAVSIGAILANEHGRKVLLIDLDPQGNLSDHVGIDPNDTERSIYNVIIEDADPSEILQTVHGMDVLPANLDLSGAEIELASMMTRESRLKNAVGPLCDNYDYVLIDCPPSLGLMTISALTLADEIIVPMQAEYLALRGLSQLIQTVDLIHQHLNPALEVSGVIFCMFDGRTNLARDVQQEVEKFFADKVYETEVRKNIRLAEAPSHGLPVSIYAPACPGTNDYRAVTGELLTRSEGHQPDPSRRQPVWKGEEPEITQNELNSE